MRTLIVLPVLALGCAGAAPDRPLSSRAPVAAPGLPAGGMLVAARTDRARVNYPGDPRPDVFTVARISDGGAVELVHEDGVYGAAV